MCRGGFCQRTPRAPRDDREPHHPRAVSAWSLLQHLLDMDDGHVRFRYKDYRADRPDTPQTMTLAATEFIRRFLLHVLRYGTT